MPITRYVLTLEAGPLTVHLTGDKTIEIPAGGELANVPESICEHLREKKLAWKCIEATPEERAAIDAELDALAAAAAETPAETEPEVTAEPEAETPAEEA